MNVLPKDFSYREIFEYVILNSRTLFVIQTLPGTLGKPEALAAR